MAIPKEKSAMIGIKKKILNKNILVGNFSRQQVIEHLLIGINHIHSTPLGTEDPCYKITKYRLEKGKKYPYPWESYDNINRCLLLEAKKRYETIDSIIGDITLQNKSRLREKVRIVLEELITNSFYHAYKEKNGTEKYSRLERVKLKPSEGIVLCYSIKPNGIFISIVDKGGTLRFETIVAALKRCYGKTESQIETKKSGAGLGLYMIFESVTHINIELTKNFMTKISCWISSNESSDVFSFNFFDGEEL